MYVRVCFRGERSFEQTIKDENDEFEENVAGYKEQTREDGRLPNGRASRLTYITYKPLIATDSPFSIVGSTQIHEQIAYLDSSDQVVLMLVLTADGDQKLQESLPSFRSLLESFHESR